MTQITQISANRHCEGGSLKQSRVFAVWIASPQAARNDDLRQFAPFVSFAFPRYHRAEAVEAYPPRSLTVNPTHVFWMQRGMTFKKRTV
jgi:hypothetical protein